MRLILCEGRYDVAALCAILDGFGCRRCHGEPTPAWFATKRGSDVTLRDFESASRNDRVYVQSVGGKADMPIAVTTRLSQADGIGLTAMGLSFDVDPGRTEADWRRSVEACIRGVGEPERVDWGYRVKMGATSVTIEPLPWLAPRPVSIASLPSLDDLDVLTFAVIEGLFPDRSPIVGRWLSEAAAAGGVGGWKSANWFAMAGWWPDAGSVDYFREVLSDPRAHGILRAGASAPLWQAIARLSS